MSKQKTDNRNKFLLAGIGVIATVQSSLEAGFDTLVAKGEVARKEYKTSVDKFNTNLQDDVREQVSQIKDRAVSVIEENTPVDLNAVKKRIDSVSSAVSAQASGLFNIPTSKDIDQLNEKLDRVIDKIAA